MKPLRFANALMLASCLAFTNCNARTSQSDYTTPQSTRGNEADNTRIQIALLLDTSNSMDGLIEQAKSRLWNIINTVTTLKYNGKTPRVEIALYEYGNDGLPAFGNYIRQVTPLTTDLDLISEKLFSLKTNGGEEYCGAVIQHATRKLDWGNLPSDMKLIYIAGNEPFDQGNIDYKDAVFSAFKKGIFVNTIFCGSFSEGIQEHWKEGADKGRGKYFNIESDKKVRFIETPYDARIQACNEKINDTYVGYGNAGISKKANQKTQDYNAESLSKANYTERAVSKSKEAYKNESWDLVDKAEKDKTAIKNIDKKQLDPIYQNKTDKELEVIIARKSGERIALQKEIQELAKQRQAYIDTENRKSNTDDDLGAAINNSIVELAVSKGFVVAK